MDNIKNIDSYVRSMSTTMKDKCWWLDRIPDTIDTIVDYGCAQGDLAIYINNICPGRFRYVGIDNSPEMLSLAAHNHCLHFGMQSKFFSKLSDVVGECDPGRTILVLNSVIHEIFSYLGKTERDILMQDMFSVGFARIAIRDMCLPLLRDYSTAEIKRAISIIKSSRYCNMWNEHILHCQNSGSPWLRNSLHQCDLFRLSEFFLKYRYVENWQRELKETYLWNWLFLPYRFPRYKTVEAERFSVPFIQDRVKSDFGIDFPVRTHMKVLLS